MSPQLLWTIAGLILTVLTLGGVSISSYQSVDASTAKLIASEVGNIALTTRLWVGNESTDGTFTGITPAAVSKYIPDLAINANILTSKASPAVAYDIAVGASTIQVVITVAGMSASQNTLVQAALTGKACTVENVSTTSATYTCNR